jgi:hypothetical protein
VAGADEYKGLIQYSHLADRMRFYANSIEWMNLTALGTLLIGDDTPVGTEKLHVAGDYYGTGDILALGTVKGKRKSATTKTTAYTALTTDRRIPCTGTFTLTLYAASSNEGEWLIIKNNGTGTITIDGNASETIDGALTVDIAAGDSITIYCNGTNWEID